MLWSSVAADPVQVTFQAAFDRLHRDMRVLLHDHDLTFDQATEDLARKGLLRREEESFLDRARALRNFLAHSNDLVDQHLVRIDISPAMTDRLMAIADRLTRRAPSARYMVPWTKVRCGTLDEPVEPLMAEMLARELSHIPLVIDGVVACIFDDRAVFRALASDKLDAIKPETRLRDIVEVGAFLKAAPEDAGVIFVGKRTSLGELRERIAKAAREDDRVSLVIVTEHGDPRQAPLGLITIWDLPEYP